MECKDGYLFLASAYEIQKQLKNQNHETFFLWNSNIQLIDSFLDSLLVHVSDDEDDWMIK